MTSREPRRSGRVAVIVGSTRPGRISRVIAEWARSILTEESALEYEIVDLAEIDLPMLDEPMPAAFGHYEHAHTAAWSDVVASFNGFFFVYPQYNWGYPGVLKNALDFLYTEWHSKPASLFTWSITGGTRGATQLYQVLQGLHMTPLQAHIEAALTEADVDHTRQLINLDQTFGSHRKELRRIDRDFTTALRGL